MTVKSKKKASALDAETQKGGNGAVDAPQAPCPLLADPTLLVKVSCTDGAVKTIHAKVEASGKKTTVAQTGIADYGTVKPGGYTAKVIKILAPDDDDYVIGEGSTVDLTLAKGDMRSVELLVDKKNVVTPKLEVEYKVVLLDPKLAQHQDAAEPEKFHAGVTYVEVSISETNKAHPYTKGAKFSCSPANVDVFLDEACTTKLSGNLSNAQLPVDTKLKLYLKGTKAGKFKAKLELLNPGDGAIRIEKEVIEAMGVVELQMELHQHNIPKLDKLSVNPDVNDIADYHSKLKDLKLPKQIVLSDADKVKKGRLLHAQDGENFGRARLLIKKYAKQHWPDGTDDYQIVLSTSADSGAIALHTDEWTASAAAAPLTFSVKDLRAKEHEFWIEGGAAGDQARSVRLDMGLDRAAGGLAKTAKRNGDWARFTVVKIDEVKVDYTAPGGGASAWNQAEQRFYINLLDDPDGRKLTIAARLSQKIADVVIHFMLAPDKNNGKKDNWGEDLPSTWPWKKVDAKLKHIDKTKRSEYLHLSAKTDAEGEAKLELTLSRFGGDKFQPGAYLEQDPHLAKYVHGHAELEKKKPVLAADGSLTVWRKVWYQVSKPAGFAPPAAAASEAAYEAVYAELELDSTKDFSSATAPARTFYPEYMLTKGSSATTPTANIGSYNKTALSALLDTKATQPVKRHLMVCLYQCDPSGTDIGQSAAIDSDQHGQWVDVIVGSDYVVEPAMAGGSMVKSLYWYRDSDPTERPIAAADARIPRPRSEVSHIQVKVPAIAPLPTAADSVYIVAECKKATGYLGESFDTRHTLAVYDASENDDFFDTITHEFGHSFNQTPRKGKQPKSIPKHPDMKDRGQGNHCQVNDGTDAGSGKTKYTCVMYDSGPMKWGLHKFCAKCHPYLLVEDFHQP